MIDTLIVKDLTVADTLTIHKPADFKGDVTVQGSLELTGDIAGTDIAQLRINNSSGTELYFQGATIATVSSQESIIFLAGLNSTNSAHVMKWGSAGDNTQMSLVDGSLGLGIESSIVAKLYIKTDAAFAKPVLILNQLDVDDSFVDFIGQSSDDALSSISELNGSFPNHEGAGDGWIRVEVNGATRWIPTFATPA